MCINVYIKLPIYLIDVLRHTQEYLTYTRLIKITVGGNKAVPWWKPQPLEDLSMYMAREEVTQNVFL